MYGEEGNSDQENNVEMNCEGYSEERNGEEGYREERNSEERYR